MHAEGTAMRTGTETTALSPEQEHNFYAAPEKQKPPRTSCRRKRALSTPIPVTFPEELLAQVKPTAAAPRPATAHPAAGAHQSRSAATSRRLWLVNSAGSPSAYWAHTHCGDKPIRFMRSPARWVTFEFTPR